MKTSKSSTQLTFPIPMFGPEDSPAKMSRWRAWAREQGLEGSALDSFMTLLASLEKHAPRVVLLENVAGLLSSHRGRDFSTVIGTLAEFGYSVGWRVLNSKNFGVPQSRQRVYIVGCHRDIHGPGQIHFEDERCGGDAVWSFAVSGRHRTVSWGGKN